MSLGETLKNDFPQLTTAGAPQVFYRTIAKDQSMHLNISLLIVAVSFLAYSIYWLANGIIWGYT